MNLEVTFKFEQSMWFAETFAHLQRMFFIVSNLYYIYSTGFVKSFRPHQMILGYEVQ